MRVRRLWIAWEKHRRSIELSKLFRCESIILQSSFSRLIKFPLFILKTFFKLIHYKPHIIFAQNPSIVLNIFLLLFKPLGRYLFVSDLHNAAIIPDNPLILAFFNFPYKVIHKYADYVIVTNKYLAEIVRENGGRPLILPDPIPCIEKLEKISLKGRFAVCCICTFGDDEPIDVILEAASLLAEEDIYFYITGNRSRFKRKYKKCSRSNNVIFTDFLPEDEYIKLIRSVNVILDLTTRDNCLVCGAYEAVAVGIPLVLSKKKILMETFTKGAIFCDNDGREVKEAILKIQSKEEYYIREVKQFKKEYIDLWYNRYTELEQSITNTLKKKRL